MRIVAYFRVSTDKQGRSGLGLAAQRRAVETMCATRGDRILAAFTEVESGSAHDNRPQLTRAIGQAKVTGAILVIAKIDRLSRNAAFLLSLRNSGVKFVAADMPDANELTIGILALVAQNEREAISARTREALRSAREAGKRLGNPNGAAALRRSNLGNVAAIAAVSKAASDRAANLREIVTDIRAGGVGTLEGIAMELTAREIVTARGGRWHRSSVRNLLARLNATLQ